MYGHFAPILALRPSGRARDRRIRDPLRGGDDTRWDGWAMCVGSGLALLLLNVLFRYGARGDEERDAEDAAREYLGVHGHWPDEI
jgi:hypothetical protein